MLITNQLQIQKLVLDSDMAKICKRNQTAPDVIQARLRFQVSYLPDDLIRQRTAVLSQSLVDFNQAVLKSLNLELASLKHSQRIHQNCILKQTKLILDQASQNHGYDIVVYQELSPNDLSCVGEVVPVYSRITKTGVMMTRNKSTEHFIIKVFQEGKKVGRWQLPLQLSGQLLQLSGQLQHPTGYFTDEYYHNDILVKKINRPRDFYSIIQYDVADNSQYYIRDRDRHFSCWQMDGTCMRSYHIVKNSPHGWVYYKSNLPNSLTLTPGLYDRGKLIEVME